MSGNPVVMFVYDEETDSVLIRKGDKDIVISRVAIIEFLKVLEQIASTEWPDKEDMPQC